MLNPAGRVQKENAGKLELESVMPDRCCRIKPAPVLRMLGSGILPIADGSFHRRKFMKTFGRSAGLADFVESGTRRVLLNKSRNVVGVILPRRTKCRLSWRGMTHTAGKKRRENEKWNGSVHREDWHPMEIYATPAFVSTKRA